ncbi:MAG: hypothetical protein ACPL1B_09160, partial [Thermoprotei archaeon]
MAIHNVKNNISSTLAAGISSTDTTMTVASGDGAKFPAPPFWITFGDNGEIAEVTAVSNDTFTITRGAQNTTAAAHSAGTRVELRITAGQIQELQFITTNAQTGTSYTLALSDAGKLVVLTNSSAITVTVPANSSVPFPIGTQIDFLQGGTGKVTFSPASGVTINSKSGNKSISAQWVGATLI